MSQPGFFDDMASGTELFLSGDVDQSWFQPDEDYGDLGTSSYDETPPKSPLFTPAPSREGTRTPTTELSRTVLGDANFSQLRPISEEEHTQNNTEPSSEKPSEDSQKLDSQRQCDSEANDTNERSVPTTSDPKQQQDILYSGYCNLFGEDSSDEDELPESDERQLSGETNTNDEQPAPATSEDNVDDDIDFDDHGSIFGGSSSNTREKNAEKITDDDIDNDPLFGGSDDSGLGTEDDSCESTLDTANCKSFKNKNLAPAPVATALEPFRLHLPEPPRANASNEGLHLPDRPDTNASQQRLHLPDHLGTSATEVAADNDFEADFAREMENYDATKDNDGTTLNLPSTPDVDIQQPAVNACVQEQNNVGQKESNVPSKSPNVESGRRQEGADTTAKMGLPQARGRGRAAGPITKLSGPPPSVFQPLESDSPSEEGKSSTRRKASHFAWAFSDHVGFGKPGPGNKYRNHNSAQNPILVADDSDTAEETNKEVNSQSQDVDRSVTKVPDAIDLASGNGDGSPVDSDKDNRIHGVDGKNHFEDFVDGQSFAQDYQSFSTPAQNHLAPTNNPIRQTPQVQPVSKYHPQVPANAPFSAPQNEAPHQPQIREHSMAETPNEVIYPTNPSYSNFELRFSHASGNFLSSPSNYSSPYSQPIQQNPDVQPLQYSYPEVENNLTFPSSDDPYPQLPVFEEGYGLQNSPMDQIALFPSHGHLNQMIDEYDDGLSDGASDGEEESSASGIRNIQNNGNSAQTSPRKGKPRPCETRAEYGYHRPWMRYDEYKYLFPLAGPRLCFENAIAKQAEEDAALTARGEVIPLRQPLTRHIKISHERLDALNQLRLSKGEEPFKPKLSGVKYPSVFLDAKRRRIEEEQAESSDYERREMEPDAKRPKLAAGPIQNDAPINGNPTMLQQDPYAMGKRQRHYLAYRVPELREKCKALKLSTLGLKGVLVQRLVDHDVNSRPAIASNSQQKNQSQNRWGVRHDQPMPDVGPMNGMQAPPIGTNYGRQQHQGQGGRGVHQGQPVPYVGPVHGMGPSNNYRQNPPTMQYPPATGYRAPRMKSLRYGNVNQEPWNGGRGGSPNNHYTPPAHGASARQESMNAGLGGYGAFQQPMNYGSNRYTHGSLQQPYSAGYQENASGRPQYSAQGLAGGPMHNPRHRIYGTSMRQRPITNGNGNAYANRAMGTTFEHMSSMNPDQNNINQTISNSLDSDAMNWQAGMQMGLGGMNWNGSTQPF
ncbi:b9bcfad2-8599-4061-a882-d960d99edcc0 [Sclerotinia trifoliorum]|uniref:B9bcfad2-8599-4061-a882-d960d99edcc0 n=1 Tax=Sclerotinia trifoliorum TaxID=28548 RepID=A0A8H2W131_9HELO|nr:b9bcfad2-8599-4061-a882-d960d99edcc0 [Sclerotinia trifoliorum]